MKGLSKLVTLSLVVLIMVIIVSLTYNFTLYFACPTNAKSISFVAASCDELEEGNDRTFKFTIRNAGSEIIEASELAVFLDGSMMDETPSFSNILSSTVDVEKSFTNKTPVQGISGEHVIKVSSPSGDVSKNVICP